MVARGMDDGPARGRSGYGRARRTDAGADGASVIRVGRASDGETTMSAPSPPHPVLPPTYPAPHRRSRDKLRAHLARPQRTPTHAAAAAAAVKRARRGRTSFARALRLSRRRLRRRLTSYDDVSAPRCRPARPRSR